MREPIRDKGRLEHMLEAIDKALEYTQGFDFDAFAADTLRVHATIYNVQIIGEAVYKLTADFKTAHPQTNWRQIEKTRHILVHDYHQIRLDILWSIVSDDLSPLRSQISNYLQEME